MEKPCRTHLLSSECNHYAYDKAPTLAYPFHELDTEASLALLIQIYFDIVDHVGSLKGQ